MAGNWKRSYGDKNRDGIDDSYDHAPGNDSQSKEYARRYDYGSTTEYTVYGVDRSDQVQAASIARENERLSAQARRAEMQAQQKVHYWPNVGKFIVPDENTWAAHAEIVKDDRSALTFNPEKFQYFDKVIAKEAGITALYDPSHPDFPKYEGLRTNLEVLRNDIMGIYMNDGSFDPGDEIFIPQIESIAKSIGQSLSHDKWYNRLLGYKSVNVDIANIEGVGAAAIYEHLLTLQKKPAPLQALRDRLNEAFGKEPDRIWQLPPLEETPYSPEGLSAPPPLSKHCLTMEDIEKFKQEQLEKQAETVMDPNHDLAAIVERAIQPVPKLSVEQLEEATKTESIEEARKILRNLRNMEFGDRDIEEWLDTGTPQAQAAKADALTRLADIYELQAQLAKAKNPDNPEDIFSEDGGYAASALRLAVAEFGLRNLPKDHAINTEIEQFIFHSPDHAHTRLAQSLERLLDNISTGLERVTGKQVYDKTPSERLVSISNRIQKSARRMRDIENMDPPARIESIALAHEILKRLKEMEASRKPLAQFIDTSMPEEKAAVAQKIDEVVDMYKNLVSEAATSNPELMLDARIQEGIEATQQFAQTVKLMAAKEMPNSVASAQHIGADATQKPDEWDKLNDRTIDRIVTSMEGGLEEAVHSIEMQEQQMEQRAEEEQREAAEMLQYVNGRLKKRRRGGYSGLGGRKQEKIDREMRADDRVLGQGIYRDDDREPGQKPGSSISASIASAQDMDRSGVDRQQQINIKHMMDDRIQGQGRFKNNQDDERRQTSSASKNTRSGRSGRRAAEAAEIEARREAARAERQQQRAQQAQSRESSKESKAGTVMGSGSSKGSSPMAGSSSRSSAPVGAIPKGLNPNKLAALENALRQEGNMLLNMNKQAGSLPPADVPVNAPARADERGNAEREQNRQGNNRPRGNERS